MLGDLEDFISDWFSKIPREFRQLFSGKDIKIIECNLEYEFGWGTAGAIKKEGDNIYIVVEYNQSYKKKRFNIAHMLGHYVYDFQDYDDSMVDFDWDKGIYIEEIRANRFARELLIPESELRDAHKKTFIPSIKEFSDHFNVDYNEIKEAFEYFGLDYWFS